MIKVDMRVETMVVEPQEVITRDNVTVQVDVRGGEGEMRGRRWC